MRLVRITEFSGSQVTSDRGLFQLLDHFPNFSLLDCQGRTSFRIPKNPQLLVLDHLDLAKDPETILEDTLKHIGVNSTLIVVDHHPECWILDAFGLTPLCHLICGGTSRLFHKPQYHNPKTIVTDSVLKALSSLQQGHFAA